MIAARVTLTDEDGRAFATAGLRDLGGETHALVLAWIGTEVPPRSVTSSLEVLRRLITTARARPQAPCFARVVLQDARAEQELLSTRAFWHRAMLEALGFEVQSQRLEVRLPLADAITAASRWSRSLRLEWRPVPTAPGALMDHAAGVLKACTAGDPDTDPNDDALGFLLARREEPELMLTPECLQIGQWEGRDAAIMAVSVKPGSGWCSFYYMGVVPECRRQGFAQETMVRGFEVMHRLGGREYHDGTAAENHAALALFDSLGAVPDLTMEQWRLAP